MWDALALALDKVETKEERDNETINRLVIIVCTKHDRTCISTAYSVLYMHVL